MGIVEEMGGPSWSWLQDQVGECAPLGGFMMVLVGHFKKQRLLWRLLHSNTGFLNLAAFILGFKMQLLSSIHLIFIQHGRASQISPSSCLNQQNHQPSMTQSASHCFGASSTKCQVWVPVSTDSPDIRLNACRLSDEAWGLAPASPPLILKKSPIGPPIQWKSKTKQKSLLAHRTSNNSMPAPCECFHWCFPLGHSLIWHSEVQEFTVNSSKKNCPNSGSPWGEGRLIRSFFSDKCFVLGSNLDGQSLAIAQEGPSFSAFSHFKCMLWRVHLP